MEAEESERREQEAVRGGQKVANKQPVPSCSTREKLMGSRSASKLSSADAGGLQVERVLVSDCPTATQPNPRPPSQSNNGRAV